MILSVVEALAIPLSIALLFILGGGVAIAFVSVFPIRYKVKSFPSRFGAEYDDVSFTSNDGILLKGWWIPAPQSPEGTVILSHGMLANRTQMLAWAEVLWRAGYNVLLYDFRANGESGGDKSTAGGLEVNDLSAAVDFVWQKSEVRDLPICLFGFSMGGAATIMVAARDSRIACAAVYGAYASLDRAISHRCHHHFGPFSPIAEWALMGAGTAFKWFAVDPATVSPEAAIEHGREIPLLLFNGGKDTIVPVTDAKRLLVASVPGSTRMIVLPRSGHGPVHRTEWLMVQRDLTAFFAAHTEKVTAVFSTQTAGSV